MTNWTPDLASLVAVFGIESIKELLFLLLRVGVALVGAFIGWLVSGPVVRVLVRMAFHRPVPPLPLKLSRLAGAVVAGVLVFIFFHFGPGGSGGGSGGGTGPGKGPGVDSGAPKDKNTVPSARDKRPPDSATQNPAARENLAIELVLSKRYKGDERYYLIQGKEPPRTLAEVEDYVRPRKNRIKQVEIIIYANSVSAARPAVPELEKVLDKYKLPHTPPPEYRTKRKPEGREK
jgi:hypothetical protein